MISKSEMVGGRLVSEYPNIWWQWTYTMPREVNPVRDLTGEHCQEGQKGGVWFLAGGYGSSKISRKCEIPKNDYIFFPIINMLYYPRGDAQILCESVKRNAALNNDKLLSIEVSLDGMVAMNPAHTRMSSDNCFDLMGGIPSDQHPPKIFPSATDGYWVMLKPLSEGKHILKFNAQYNREKGAFSKMVQDIEYELIVK
ncbi:MAG: hypothetical protein HZT40_07680 [Candidatus Thiothrix singaporensis]|uniref:Uncharacterized protein n=1 Tax=Candidatus Thiothrix singaporensis TaxID=2799669 RepID=A0A7L6AQX2_9GAMM|nr:MAG: hypothetical protein HZT40_07680 [Candidatus Thiothrix singaporensis]